MLRAGYVDVRWCSGTPPTGRAWPRAGRGEPRQRERIDLAEGLREKLLLDEPVHLVTSASAQSGPGGAGPGGAEPPAELTDTPGTGGSPAATAAGPTSSAVRAGRVHPEDRVHTRRLRRVQALVAPTSGLHPAALCLRARGTRNQDRALPGAHRYVFAYGTATRPTRPR